jgi:exodeoxyribonuclease VII small subunit
MEEQSFEAGRAELEQIVRQLEEGDLSLEETLSLYERGQALARYCQAQLDQAELRITQLSEAAGESLPGQG